jgi:hypothetical protein
MRRCEFITLVGSAVCDADAQQRERTRRIGVLRSVVSDDPKGYRWPQAMPTSIVDSRAELVALTPNFILATASSTVAALHGGNPQ